MVKDTMQIRVYYEDTDCGNVVYYANYLKYMERGRTELMRGLGTTFAQFHDQGFRFVVTDVTLKYHASAYYDELLDMETSVKELTPVTIIFHTVIKNPKGVTLVTGDAKAACVNTEGKLKRMPKEIVEKLSRE
jgi:acyl-CoA thioester hydrolase